MWNETNKNTIGIFFNFMCGIFDKKIPLDAAGSPQLCRNVDHAVGGDGRPGCGAIAAPMKSLIF